MIWGYAYGKDGVKSIKLVVLIKNIYTLSATPPSFNKAQTKSVCEKIIAIIAISSFN